MSGKNHGPSDENPSIPSFDGEDRASAVGFEFSNFAKSEADALARAQEEAERQRRRPTSAPEQRKIMRRSYLPPTDVVVDTRPIGQMTVVTLRGRINESFRGAELGQTLSGHVVFDLAEVDRVSSFGVKGWLQMLEQARVASCTFLRCSEAVVNQITMMRNFCGPGRIHSLMVPYTCNHCGEEFGALYEAVADREVILNRSPVLVECPNCHQAAEMDDDPWSYFAIDEHLLDAVPFELQQVVDHLTSSARIDPIEKFISEQETRIRFNAPLDARLRLRRAFAGLEGRVTLDLSVVPRSDAEGVANLVDALRDLGPEVSELWVDGASVDLVRRLVAQPVDRVYLSSMFLRARCLANGIERPVLVDVDRRRALLEKQQLPPVEANWAMGNVDLADTDVLFEAAVALAPPPDQHRSRPLDTLPRAPQTVYPSEPPLTRPAAPNQQFRNFAILFSIVMFAVALIALVGVGYVFVTQRLASTEPEPEVVEGPVDGWNGGEPVPPPWVDQRFVLDDEQVLVVGEADGTEIEPTSERARSDAVARLVDHLRSEVSGRAAGPALRDEPLITDAATISRQFLDEVGDWAEPVRTNSAIKKVGPMQTVVTQHRLTRETWDKLVTHYGDGASFRGLSVARRFPTDYGTALHERTPLVVIRVASWFTARVGDGFVSVDEQTVETPYEFRRAAVRAWKTLEEGESLQMQLFHRGNLVPLEFDRTPSEDAAPEPEAGSAAGDLLPYEGRP